MIIAGGFGVAWVAWASSGLVGAVALVVRIAGIVIGVLIVARAVQLRRAAAVDASSGRPRSMFRSTGYRLVVIAEVIALFGGNAVLGATGRSAYVAAWTGVVVGVHFLGFGRLFASVFYWLGVAFVVAGVAGAIAGVIRNDRAAVEVTTGLIAGASLFAAGVWGLREASEHPGTG